GGELAGLVGRCGDDSAPQGDPTAEAEQPGRPLDPVAIPDDLGLAGPRLGRDVHALEVAQVDEPLPGAIPLLQRVELALVQRQLPAQDLVLAPNVAVDVDALDVDFRPLGDLEGHVDDVVGGALIAAGIDVGRRAADRAVEVQDALDAVAHPGEGEDVRGLEPDLPVDLALGHQGDAGDVHIADLELGPLHHRDRDRHPRALAVDGDVGRLDPSLDEAPVVVEREKAVDVGVQPLPLHLAAQDEVLALLRLHRVLELRVGQPFVTVENDLVDGDLAPLDDVEDQAHVAVAELLDGRGDLDLEVALVLVVVAELVDGALHVDRVVDTPELDVDLLLQGFAVSLLVSDEVDVPYERALGYDEDHLHSALEVLNPHLDVVEKTEAEDGLDVLREARGIEGRADGALDAAEDDGFLHPPVALDADVADEDRLARRRLRAGSCDDQKARSEHNGNGETHSSRCRHRPLRCAGTAY